MAPICERVGRRAAGQASVELVAVLPALVLADLLAFQLLRVGSNAEAVARRALPGRLRDGAEVRTGDGVRVKVPVPGVIPGIELPAVSAASRLDAGTD